MSDELTIGEAAKRLGVSTDTLRRWDRAGRLQTVRDARNRRLVSAEEVERLRRAPIAMRPAIPSQLGISSGSSIATESAAPSLSISS